MPDAVVRRARRHRRRRSTRSPTGSTAAAGSSTSGPARRAGSRSWTPPSASRRSPRRPGSSSRSSPAAPRSAATAQEHAEDDEAAGAASSRQLGVGPTRRRRRHQRERQDAVRRSERSGGSEAGALTVGSCPSTAPSSAALAEHEIAVVVGPEVIAGSTRLKAGHGAEARPQHDLDDRDGAAREDLRQPDGRRRRHEREAPRRACGESWRMRPAAVGRVEAALDAADGDAKVAIVSLLAGVDADDARARLEAAAASCGGRWPDAARGRGSARRRARWCPATSRSTAVS